MSDLPLLPLKIALAALCIMVCTPASAHLSRNTEIAVDAKDNGVAIEIIVPASEYRLATGNETSNAPEAIERARAAVSGALALVSEEGEAWSISAQNVAFTSGDGPTDLVAHLVATPPTGASQRTFALRWEMLARMGQGRIAMVYRKSDPRNDAAAQATLLGALSPADPVIEIDLGQAASAQPGLNAFWLGVHHILEGYDHLLFLIALMLPAPLIARRGTWSLVRPATGAIAHIGIIVTAFTLGHSITLVIASFWPVLLPAVIVESVIALSVLVSAAHAIRPVFANREPVVGFAFGLVHGLAFATLLDESGIASEGSVFALFGFTLGIEAVQLGLAAVVMPALVLLSRARSYSRFRVFAGIIVFLAAGLWLINRTTGIAGQLVEMIEAAMAYGGIAIAVLVIAALAVWMRMRSGHAEPALHSRT